MRWPVGLAPAGDHQDFGRVTGKFGALGAKAMAAEYAVIVNPAGIGPAMVAAQILHAPVKLRQLLMDGIQPSAGCRKP